MRRQREEGLTQFLAAEGNNESLWLDMREGMAFDRGVDIQQMPETMQEGFRGMRAFAFLEEVVRPLLYTYYLHYLST